MASVVELTASCIVIPAPLALEEVSPAPKFKVIFLSFTSKLVVFIVVVVPETVKSPEIVALPVISIPEAEVVILAALPRFMVNSPFKTSISPPVPVVFNLRS